MTDNVVLRVITATSLFLERGGVMILPVWDSQKYLHPAQKRRSRRKKWVEKGGQEKQEDRPSRE